jgi:hypothetical protein
LKKLETDIFVGSARRAGVVLLAALAFAGAACKSQRSRVTVQNEEPPPAKHLLSTIQMNDAAAAPQLLSGFYAVENNAWRWTSGKFSVSLRTPPAAQNGATVALAFTVPEVIIQKLGKIKVTMSAAGKELKSQEYDTAGPYVLSGDIPAGPQLRADSITVDFTVNKTTQPDGDKRELAIVANSVSITPK